MARDLCRSFLPACVNQEARCGAERLNCNIPFTRQPSLGSTIVCLDERKRTCLTRVTKRLNRTRVRSPTTIREDLSEAKSDSSLDEPGLLDLSKQIAVTEKALETTSHALQTYFQEVRAGFKTILKNPPESIGKLLAQESKMIYLMTCNDYNSAILPFMSMGLSVLTRSPSLQAGDLGHFWVEAAGTMSKELLYSSLYLYCFNLANQYVGAPVEVIDKPWRPIPAGLVTREGALARFFLVFMLFSFVSWQLDVLPYTIAWECCILGQFLGLEKDKSSRGLGRSVAMGIGTWVASVVGVSLVTPMTATLSCWAVTRSLVTANHHWMQDFRDIKSDMKVGRTTFPIVLGLEKARKLMAFIFLMDPIAMHFLVMKDSDYSTAQLVCEGVLALLSAILAYRVMSLKTAEEDQITYSWWLATYWHNCAYLLVSPAFLLGH